MGFIGTGLRGKLAIAALFLFFTAASLWPQVSEPVSFIGMTLAETIQRFGIPRSVYAVRGIDEWQDDVVFVYDAADFYIYKDRVWQAGLKEARGIKIGDPGAVIPLILGSSAVDMRENSFFYSINEGAWPLVLRFNTDNTGIIKAIFIYRTDM